MVSKSSVLIVGESAETREVLRTALAWRGAEIWEATRADEGLDLARRHHPSVIVLDLEIADQASDTIQAGFRAGETARTPIVVLGSARRGTHDFPTGQFVAKPYHYGPLIRKIEHLLDEARQVPTEDA